MLRSSERLNTRYLPTLITTPRPAAQFTPIQRINRLLIGQHLNIAYGDDNAYIIRDNSLRYSVKFKGVWYAIANKNTTMGVEKYFAYLRECYDSIINGTPAYKLIADECRGCRRSCSADKEKQLCPTCKITHYMHSGK